MKEAWMGRCWPIAFDRQRSVWIVSGVIKLHR